MNALQNINVTENMKQKKMAEIKKLILLNDFLSIKNNFTIEKMYINGFAM